MTDRADRLIAELTALGDGSAADLMLVTSLANVRYLTGYTGSNGVALIGPETRVFFTDFRYQEQSAVEVDPSYQRRIERSTCWRDSPTCSLPGSCGWRSRTDR